MKADPLVLDVRADLFRAATRFLPDPEHACGHPELDGVHVAPCPDGGCILVAGDGAGIIVMRDPDGRASRPVTLRLPPHILALAHDVLKGRARKPPGEHVDPAKVRVSVRMTTWRALRARITPSAGVECDVHENRLPFPDWRALVPARASIGGAFALSAAEAQRLAATATSLAQAAGLGFETARKSPLSIFLAADERRAVVRFRHWDDAFALVLPAALCSAHEIAPPDWTAAPVTEAA